MIRNRRECRSCHRTEDQCNIICVTDHPDCHDGDYCEDCNPYEMDRALKYAARCKIAIEDAETIERLRTELSISVKNFCEINSENEALKAENEKLKAAQAGCYDFKANAEYLRKELDSREREAFEAGRESTSGNVIYIGYDSNDKFEYKTFDDYKKARGE